MTDDQVLVVVVGPDYLPVPVSDMTLDQAREAVCYLAAELQRVREDAAQDRRMRELFSDARLESVGRIWRQTAPT